MKEFTGIYYLVEQVPLYGTGDIMTSEWETNFTMYDTDVDSLIKRIAGDRMYMLELDIPSPTGIMYRIIHPRDEFLDKFVCIIQSII